MVSYEYGEPPQQNSMYQLPYSTLPAQQSTDSTNPYSFMTPLTTQKSLPLSNYSSRMIYPPKMDTSAVAPTSTPLSMQPISYLIGASAGIFSLHLFLKLSLLLNYN